MEQLHSFFEEVFFQLDTFDNHVLIVAVFLSAAALAIVFRVLTHLHLRAILLAMQIDAKKAIEDRKDIKKLRNSLLRKCVAEYIKTSEGAAAAVSPRLVSGLITQDLRFASWRYTSLLPFLLSLERAFLWIGLILALVFSHFTHVYGILAILAFLGVQISSTFFDPASMLQRLPDEIAHYIEKNITRFFAADTGGAILRLKNDLASTIDSLSKNQKKAFDGVGSAMTHTLREFSEKFEAAVQSIGPAVAEAAAERLLEANEVLVKSQQGYTQAILDTQTAQAGVNAAAKSMAEAAKKLDAASETLAVQLRNHAQSVGEQSVQIIDMLEQTRAALNVVHSEQQAMGIRAETFEQNQRALESSLASYEATLQSLTANLGDGIGTYLGLHTAQSLQAIQDALRNYSDSIIARAEGENDNRA